MATPTVIRFDLNDDIIRQVITGAGRRGLDTQYHEYRVFGDGYTYLLYSQTCASADDAITLWETRIAKVARG